MKYPTDKIQHKLIPEYEILFSDYKNKYIKILEIGVKRGGSLMWMADYFSNAEIIGGDMIVPKNIDGLLKYNNRIHICELDQNNLKSLIKIGNDYGPFDIIIDDGCHQAMGTKNTFEILWEKMICNGLYIIEDFIAGYWPNTRFKGVPNIITDIMLRKNELGITDYGIILKEPKCSIAYFKKK